MEGGANEAIASVRRALRSVRQRRWLALFVAAVVGLICAAGAALIPERFEASASVYVDTQTVLKPMMVGLTYQPDVDQQVRMLAKTLISRPNVERVLEHPELGFKFASPLEREAAINRLTDRIKVVAAGGSNFYSIVYRDSDPVRARQLVDFIVNLFLNSGANEKRKDSKDASRFIDEQIRSNEVKLVDAESRLKDFKVRNFGVSGVSNQDYFARISTLSDEVTKLRNELHAAEQSRDAYRKALAAEDPQLPAESLPGVTAPSATEVDGRLDAQRKQLDDLLRRFTEDHPDVVSARRLVGQLERQRQAELAAKAQENNGRAKGTAATSPVYQKIRFSLAESEAQVASLRSQLSGQTERLAQTRALAGRVPQVEAEFAQLNRDYDVIRKNYDQLVARRESAALGVKLDESSQLAEFRVVEPPRVGQRPVFPGHVHLAAIAAVLAIASGIAAALLMDLLRPTLVDVKSLEELTGRPVIGTVSLSKTPSHQRAERTDRMRFAAVATMLMGLQIAWLTWLATHSIGS